jgi:FkbM family methyltransferase
MFIKRIQKLMATLASWRFIKALLFYRVLAGSEHHYVLSLKFTTIVDIGANRGQFALAARQYCPDAMVIAFEPLIKPAAVFNKVFSGDPRVTLHNVAISEEEGRREMHVSKRDDSSSLLPIAQAQEDLYPGTEEVSILDVNVGPLRKYIASPELNGRTLLKIDVQGYEYQVLVGCHDLINKFSYVYCEASFIELYSNQKLAKDVIEWMETNGFLLNGAYNFSYSKKSGQAIQADLLFKRQDIDR